MEILEASKKRILLLDGAMGTALQNKNLTAEDFGGEDLEGCNENLVLTRPDVIQQVHEMYLRAGADIIETNTFGGTPVVLDEYKLGHLFHEINFQAAKLAKESALKFSTPDQPRFVAGSIGPTTKAISVTGGITFQELIENFYAQSKALQEGGVDYFLLETCQDTRNVKAGLLALQKLKEDTGVELPIAVSCTIEPMGTMLAGQAVEAFLSSIEHQKLLYVGLNCATGPEFMTESIRSLSKLSPFGVSCVPNAGLPDEDGNYLESPEMVAKVVSRFIEQGWINFIGGCCGTTEKHIEALSKIREGKTPRPLSQTKASALSGIEYLEITDEMRPVLVGERTNVIGSRKFKRLIVENQFEEASEIARAQIKNGAQIIDICLANPDRDELEDTEKFFEKVIKMIKAPIMIDSTDESVIEKALQYCQGKSIINSVNLEDGLERFEKVCPLVKKYGAALVVGCIDDHPEQGMAVSRERKLEVAKRSYHLLTKEFGIPEEDIYWDPLVFPCATGDENYVGSAKETIEGVRLLKEHFPKTKTVLGISNVSFGLPDSGREILNSVFLYHCVQAGLDLAIVNTEKLERYAKISKDEIELAENLLFVRGEDPIGKFAAHFRTKVKVDKKPAQSLPLEERLSRYILEGSKDGLKEDLDLALEVKKPLEIINGPLMKGMDEVGKLFNANQLIVAEVLQSAEAMKAAVSYLEPKMEKTETSKKGKVLLATVKGDVHDIGKNLVDIIFTNNGFDVINLGIKIPPEKIIEAVKMHKPHLIGLSGLLVKSAQQMITTAEDLKQAGIETPILVGGAALTSTFVDRKISPAYHGTVAYASDAMSGLDLAKQIVDPIQFEELKDKLKNQREKKESKENFNTPTLEKTITHKRSSLIKVLDEVPTPTDFQRHVLKNTPLPQIFPFINPLMFYGRHLGIKGSVVRKLELSRKDAKVRKELVESESRALEIYELAQTLMKESESLGLFQPKAVYQFFKASSDEKSIFIFNEKNEKISEFQFPRQKKTDGLCLSDYLTKNDNLCMFVVTAGAGVRKLAEEYKEKGDYLRSHMVQALALETAEAYAEYLHSQIRKIWGFPDLPGMTMMERFQAKYRGKRYSFGYPACPLLDDQKQLFDLLKPEEIGVELTEGFMMDPEASVSAVVFHHPEATYFSVGQGTEGAYDENR